MYPMDLINSKNWKLTLPVLGAREIKQTALATYSSEWMRLNDAGDGVVFKAPTDGGTTTNSKNPRSELREMTADGKEHASWSTTAGVHTMDIEQSVDVLQAGSKPHVVVGQIHDANDDVTVFRMEGSTNGNRNVASIWITKGDTTHGFLVTDAYRLGTKFRVGFQVAKGIISYTFNGRPVNFTLSKFTSGCYFKAGSYNQSGGNVTPMPNGESDYAQVTIYSLQVCHDGVCTGNAPGATIPPIDPPPPTPEPVPTDSELVALKARIVTLETDITLLNINITKLRASLGAIGAAGE